jgi:hypothetical protein
MRWLGIGFALLVVLGAIGLAMAPRRPVPANAGRTADVMASRPGFWPGTLL